MLSSTNSFYLMLTACVSLFIFAGLYAKIFKKAVKDNVFIITYAAIILFICVICVANSSLLGDASVGEDPIKSPIALVLIATICSLTFWFIKYISETTLTVGEVCLAMAVVYSINADPNLPSSVKVITFIGASLAATHALIKLNALTSGKLTNWMMKPVQTDAPQPTGDDANPPRMTS